MCCLSISSKYVRILCFDTPCQNMCLQESLNIADDYFSVEMNIRDTLQAVLLVFHRFVYFNVENKNLQYFARCTRRSTPRLGRGCHRNF